MYDTLLKATTWSKFTQFIHIFPNNPLSFLVFFFAFNDNPKFSSTFSKRLHEQQPITSNASS